MAIRYSYSTKGHLTLKELEGLSKLCREEEDVRWAILNANSDLSPYYRRLLAYSKKNKFNFGDFTFKSVVIPINEHCFSARNISNDNDLRYYKPRKTNKEVKND